MSYVKLYTDELKNKGLTIYDKAVYGSLLTKFQYHNNQAFYTFEKFIADELEISERTVQRSIKKLVEVGLLSITKKFHKQLKQSVNYYNLSEQNFTNQSLISTPINEEVEQSFTIEETSEQKPNNEEIKGFNNDYMFYDFEQTDDEKISNTIENNYQQTPDEYFRDINKLSDIKFSMLEDISYKSETNPQAVLNYIKQLRHIA